MYDSSRILRVGGVVGFDFLNTNYKWVERVEVFDSSESLISWFLDSKLLSDTDVIKINQQFSSSDFSRLLSDALELRARLRDFLIEFKEIGALALSEEKLLYFNNILRRDGSRLKLEVLKTDQIMISRSREWNNIEEILSMIIESIFSTIRDEDFDLVKTCENPKCPLWFVDHSKAHRRKFCSQAICGNRSKQAAFRSRNQIEN